MSLPIPHRWSGKVKTHWHPTSGLFTRDPGTIARVLLQESASVKQAISRLMFYSNRAGRNLDTRARERLHMAMRILEASER